MRTYDFTPLFSRSVGFDRMQSLLDAALERSEVSYPPYNIETDGEDVYRISVAVAGFGEKDLDVTVENETLTISGRAAGNDDGAYLHRGIAGRTFQLKFNLADHIKVHGASLENGMLVIDLEREVPEELKPRRIDIQTSPVTSLAKKAKKLIGGDSKKAA